MARDWFDDWRDVAKSKSLGSDLLAGLTVAAVALPLNLALAVASGLPPAAGLIAGSLGGALAALFGGARLQVTGPAAALSGMVLLISKEFGVEGVAAAALMIGVMQMILALTAAGKLARFVPESVLAGFTTGVGLKLLDGQVPEALGFNYTVFTLAQMMHRPLWLHHVSWLAAMCSVFVALMVVGTKQFKRFPAAIVAIAMVTFVAVYLNWDVERIGAIPSTFPAPSLPDVEDDRWLDLFIAVIPLGLLAGVESLLSASVLDRMMPGSKPHNSNLELFGQSLANTAVGLMSGLPVTGVVVRSGVNVQSGAKTRLSAFFHGVFLAGAVLYLSQTLSLIPLAALAGLLCVVGVRLLEFGTFFKLLKSERVEAAAFALAAGGTVSGHLMLGLAGAMALHAINRFFHRHEEAERVQLVKNKQRGIRAVLHRERAEARRPLPYEPPPEHHAWLTHIQERARIAPSAFVHHKASVIGRVVLGDHVHIAAGSSVRADEGSPFFIGSNSNLQDGVVVHALKDKKVLVGGEEWAVYVGRNVSIAHDALVHGPCFIGDDTFVGFKAVVHDSIVGSHCFIGIGSVVVGVEIPEGRLVPHGTIVDTPEAVARLPLVGEVHSEFNEDVVEVNRGLAMAYHADRTAMIAPRYREIEDDQSPPVWDERWTNAGTREIF